jgi:DNA helicase HerA-like ATPase
VTDILIGRGDKPAYLLSKYANRHGLVAGATGTGKTVTLLTMAEGLSRIGVPVFIADVKGDVSGLAVAGASNPTVEQRAKDLGVTDYRPEANPVVFWDLFGQAGHPIRTTVSEVGPMLLARMLELNDVQSGVVDIVFKMADDEGLLLLDLEDLRAVLNVVVEKRAEVSQHYGLVSAQSVAAIQRALLKLESAGGTSFFGEPALDLNDLMRVDLSGRGVISVLAADKLVLQPRLYSTLLLWLLSELYEALPEVGDLDKPKLAFMFDEAHLLFNDAPPALLQRVEQVVRLVRSKGVGVYFCSQFPDDVPGEVLGQLGNRVQHALRAFTPRDQKAVRTAAETFVPNPAFKVADVISALGVGEALVSLLQANAVPMPVERARVAPPRCRMGAITPDERAQVIARSPIGAKYNTAINRESAFEVLAARKAQVAEAAPSQPSAAPTSPSGGAGAVAGGVAAAAGGILGEFLWGTSRRQGMVETMAKQAARTVGSQVGRQILRGVLGGILGGTSSRARR